MSYFVAGTDTDSGKTFVASALLHLASIQGKTSLGVKPIASGSSWNENSELQNSDALSLMAASNIKLAYNCVNPLTFEPAIAPHIAAAQQGIELSVSELAQLLPFEELNKADFALIEGAGGWRLPLNDSEFLSDFVKQHRLPVILVVGVKLGCLNHALLTQEAILADGLNIAGWVANQAVAEVSCLQENLAYLHRHMKAPCLGTIPFLTKPDIAHAAEYLDLSSLS